VVAIASLRRKSRSAAAIFVVLAIFLVSLALCAPVARAQSWGEVVLHSFDGTDGANPSVGLIHGRDGNFYGTTEYGGANQDADHERGGGTVFKLAPSGALTTLYSFCNVVDPNGQCSDGAGPDGLIQSSDGNFYGITGYGGANPNGIPSGPDDRIPNGQGTVFKLTPSGTLTTLYSFCKVVDPGHSHCTDGTEPNGLIQGSDGNFYGTTASGGANTNGVQNGPGIPNGPGTVFKLTPSGQLTTLYSFCSQANCIDGDTPNGLIQGSDGNFYGTTSAGGGAKSGGTVFKLTPSGTLTTLYTFCSVFRRDPDYCLDGGGPNAGVIKGGDGDFYGTTSDGGANVLGGTVFKLTPTGTLTTLHSFSGEADDTASPNGVILGKDGNLYGTTAGGPLNQTSTVFELTPSGKLTTLYAFCRERGTCTCPDGDAPSSLIEGIDGNFYGTTSVGGANGYDSEGGAKGYGTVFKVGASLPTPTDTPTATSTPGHIAAVPNESACDVSKAKADDLLALAPLGSLSFPDSPGVKCTVEGLSPASYYCGTKTETVLDQMLGQGRRLIVMRTTNTRKSRVDDQLFVFGCAFGRVVRMLTSGAGSSGGELKIEKADPNQITFSGPPTPPGNVFGARERQTLDVVQNPQPLADTLPCGELKTAKANDLIILANHEFQGEFGGFPFTHGVGCYENDDWRVTLYKDRMISASRREIFVNSTHLTGTGDFGYSYVFGCVAEQVRLVFGTTDGAVRSACDEQAPPGSRDRQPSESPSPGYKCASWEDSKSDQLTSTEIAWAPGGRTLREEVMTFKWSPELQNYVLTSVHYRSRGD